MRITSYPLPLIQELKKLLQKQLQKQQENLAQQGYKIPEIGGESKIANKKIYKKVQK